jgi:predicted transcriptional regulator
MSEVMTIRVDRKIKARLEKLAKVTARSKSWLAAEAIRAYIELNEWQIAEIKTALKEADSADARFVEHAEVEKWLASWGTARERKPPL